MGELVLGVLLPSVFNLSLMGVRVNLLKFEVVILIGYAPAECAVNTRLVNLFISFFLSIDFKFQVFVYFH